MKFVIPQAEVGEGKSVFQREERIFNYTFLRTKS